MNSRLVALFFRDLSNMLVSGISLEHALRTLNETSLDEGARKMCGEALERLQNGDSFASALSASGELPREAFMSISAGETAGELPMVACMLGEYFELKAEIKRRVFSALGYPAAVIGILLCVLVYMSIEVLPKIAALLPAGAIDSPITMALLSAALFLKSWWFGTCLALFLGISIMIAWMHSDPAAVRIFFSRAPFLGRLLKDQELSLGFFALYVLQKSGVPLETALREAADVAGGETRRHFQDCSSYLVGGLVFSEAVRRDKYFPRFTADTLRIGEESGRFEEYFERLYRVFYRMFQSRMDQLAGSVRPFLLLVSAAFIVLIAIGFLQPIYGNLTNIASP